MAKILLVEDDQLLVRLYQKKFTMEGFTVVTARDGSEGIVRAQNEQPDIILLDLMMPKATGYDMLQVLQGSPQLKNIPVVVLTNLSSDVEEERARAMGATDYLVKANNPPAVVVDRIKELLARDETEESDRESGGT
ncbi:MAG: response regulator [Candidatus Andersenbacteria bacterium]|nr:response regulator [Candidatus Andersenbacteria bacterium]